MRHLKEPNLTDCAGEVARTQAVETGVTGCPQLGAATHPTRAFGDTSSGERLDADRATEAV